MKTLKYTESAQYANSEVVQEAPKLFLGQIQKKAEFGNGYDLQWELRHGDDVVDAGVGRTVNVTLEEIEVNDNGQALNVQLSRNRMYIVKSGFNPDTTGLGSIPRK